MSVSKADEGTSIGELTFVDKEATDTNGVALAGDCLNTAYSGMSVAHGWGEPTAIVTVNDIETGKAVNPPDNVPVK